MNNVIKLMRKRQTLRKNIPIPDSAIIIFQFPGVEVADCIASGVVSIILD